MIGYENIEMSFWEKIKYFIEITQKVILISIICVFLFSVCFFCIWMFLLLIRPNLPHSINKPNLQIKPTDPQSLLAIYSNNPAKNQICRKRQQQIHNQVSLRIIGLTMTQYCNLNHQSFPNIQNQVDIRVTGLVVENIEYVNACLHRWSGKQNLACQKYQPTSNILIFHSVMLKDVSHFSVQIHKKSLNNLKDIPEILFQQKINIIEQYVREYYYIVSILVSGTLAVLCCILYCIWEVSKVVKEQEVSKKNQFI